MPISSFDFISPKITLKYNGRNSHISRIGGFLSLCLFITICILVFYCFWSLIEPRFYSFLLYEENSNDSKLSQKINFSGINHFLQIYSHTNDGWFGDIDNKNIIIYAVKENNKIYRNNYFSEKLSDTEHWLYDKCDKINNINMNLFEDISNYVKNYTSSICIRFYFNPKDQRYYEIGNDGYVEPYLETSKVGEKQYPFKIIIEKCLNNSFINNNIGYTCNSEININKYFDIYDEIFIYFTYNQIMPLNKNNQFKKNYYSISSKLNQFSYFVNNIIFLPIKIIKQKSFSNTPKDNFSFSLYNHFEYQKSYDNESENLVGIYNLYLNRNILSYQIRFSNIIDILSHLGGLIKIFFLFFKILNYANHRFIVFENTKELFNINTGIETNFTESKDISFDNIRHITTKNFKINQLNTNTNEDVSKRLIRNFSPVNNNKKKYKYLDGITPKGKQSSKKNISLFQINASSNKKNNLTKKNTITFNIKNRDKRKSYLSQGYRVKSKVNKDNIIYIRNKSFRETEEFNNEKQSSRERNNNINNENNSIVLIPSKKSNNDFNPIKNKKAKKSTNLKLQIYKNTHDKIDNTHSSLKNHNNIRHKSINYTNQKKFFRNSIFNKSHFVVRNESELINDSSKQNLFNNKNILLNINRTQYDKSKIDENNCRAGVINNNTVVANSTKNLRTLGINNNNLNGNGEPSLFFKALIKKKLKLEMTEGKEGLANIISKKIKAYEFLKSLFLCCKKNENKVDLINNFRNNLLSEQHLYRNHINVYLIQKLFQIEESFKLDFKELYINL